MVCAVLATACRWTAAGERLHEANLPNPTHAGYLDVARNAGSKIYYQFYEADREFLAYVSVSVELPVLYRHNKVHKSTLWKLAGPHPDLQRSPIILWLQVTRNALWYTNVLQVAAIPQNDSSTSR